MIRKDKGFRGPRRRGFDDDMPYMPESSRGGGGGGGGSSRPPARTGGSSFSQPMVAEGPTVVATVKWFNPEKGFGFAELANNGGDAFLHVGALQASGFDSVAPGAKLKVNVGQGAKGPQITRVLEVDESTATPAPARGPSRGAGPRTGGRHAADVASAVTMAGTVKWFNGDKGFGFVASEDGGKDVFVHVSVLNTAGLDSLPEGQRVSMKVVDTPKGREAVSISIG